MSKDQVSTEVANQAINEALAAQPIAPAADVSAPTDDKEAFEAWWSANMNLEVMGLHPFVGGGYACHETNRGWLVWQAARAAAPVPRPYFPLTPEQVQQIATKVAGCQTNPHERPFWEFGTITLQQFATDLTDYTTRVYSNNSTAGAAIPAQAAPVSDPTDAITYTVDGERMSPLEHISHSHDLLQKAAPVSGQGVRLPPLPKPDTHCYDEDTKHDVWSHSPDQIREYGQLCVAYQRIQIGHWESLYDAAIQIIESNKRSDAMMERLGIDSRPRSEDSRAKEQYSATVWRTQAEGLETENKSLRDHLALRDQHKAADLWFWQGDEDDKLESMSNGMAVVIRADQLRALASTTPPKAGNE